MADNQSDLFMALYDALHTLPFVEVAMLDGAPEMGGRTNLVHGRQRTVVLTSGAIAFELVPIIRREVFPRDARMILWDLQNRLHTMRQGRLLQVPIVVAQGISAGARSMLREAGTSYYDLTGSIYLLSEGLYLFIDKPASKRLVRLSQVLFAGLRRRIVHQLLQHPDIWFSVADLACRAGASTATTSQTLRLLEKHEWVETSGKGPTKRRRLLNPGNLAGAWAEARRVERCKTAQRFAVPANMPPHTLTAIVGEHCARKGTSYAFTDLVAGQLHLGKVLTATRLACYLMVNESLDDLIKELGSVRDDRGDLMVFPMPSDPAWIRSVTVKKIRIVDPIEAYIDLMADGETALAVEIRRTLLAF